MTKTLEERTRAHLDALVMEALLRTALQIRGAGSTLRQEAFFQAGLRSIRTFSTPTLALLAFLVLRTCLALLLLETLCT